MGGDFFKSFALQSTFLLLDPQFNEINLFQLSSSCFFAYLVLNAVVVL